MDEKQLAEFLKRIKQLESGSGKNVKHATMTSGMHKGQAAIGQYGLMPNTIDELLGRLKREKRSLPELADLAEMSPAQKREFLASRPDIEEALARNLGSRVLEKQGGDEEKAAYTWLHGSNLPEEAVEKRKYQEDPYVKRYKALKPEEKPAKLDVEGSPDAQRIRDYFEKHSEKESLKKSMLDRNEQINEAMMLASQGPLIEHGPEERAKLESLDPNLRALLEGGPAGGIATKGFSNLKRLMQSGTPASGAAQKTTEELLERAPASIKELIAPKSQLLEEAITENPAVTRAIERQQMEEELEALKKAAKHMGEDTI